MKHMLALFVVMWHYNIPKGSTSGI